MACRLSRGATHSSTSANIQGESEPNAIMEWDGGGGGGGGGDGGEGVPINHKPSVLAL